MMWKEPKKKKKETFESRNQDDRNKVRERSLPFNMTTRDATNAPSPSLPQHQISQQRQKRPKLHLTELECVTMLSDVHVCVCERMHLSQCFWLYLNKVSLCLLDHQDQASTPEGQSPPAIPSVVGRKLSSVCAPLSTLILIPPSFHIRWGKRCWITEDYQHSEPVSSLPSLSSSACRHSCRFPPWRDRIHSGFFWVVSWIMDSSQFICSYCMSHQQYMYKRTHTRTHTENKRLSHDLTLDKRPNFMFGINYLSFPQY